MTGLSSVVGLFVVTALAVDVGVFVVTAGAFAVAVTVVAVVVIFDDTSLRDLYFPADVVAAVTTLVLLFDDLFKSLAIIELIPRGGILDADGRMADAVNKLACVATGRDDVILKLAPLLLDSGGSFECWPSDDVLAAVDATKLEDVWILDRLIRDALTLSIFLVKELPSGVDCIVAAKDEPIDGISFGFPALMLWSRVSLVDKMADTELMCVKNWVMDCLCEARVLVDLEGNVFTLNGVK